MQKGFLAFLVLLFVCISIPAFAQSGIRIAVVDTEKAFQESVWGKKALEEMEKEAAGWQKEGEQIDNEITKLEEDLTKRQQFLDNKDEEQKLQDQIDSKRLEGQNLIQKGQASLKQKQQELMDPIIQEIKDLIKKIAMEDGYDLVLEKQLDIYKIVLYVNPELDITSKVTVMIDKSYKDKNQSKVKESEKEAGKPADKPKESGKEDSK